MKLLGKKNYGSIPHLQGSRIGKTDKYAHEGQCRILTEKVRDANDYISVTEKYDGSNVGICKHESRIHALTKSGYLANTSPYKQHHYFSDWVESQKTRFDFLQEGERVCGEWMMQAHGTKYKIADEPFLAFDFFYHENNRLNFEDLSLYLRDKFLLPRVLWRNSEACPIERAMSALDSHKDPSFVCDRSEGVVYRVDRNGKFDFMAKYVRNDFEPGKFIIGIEDGGETWNVFT